jgi:hypothetical protein
MMHAMSMPAERRAELARTSAAQAARLVDFLLRAASDPAAAGQTGGRAGC